LSVGTSEKIDGKEQDNVENRQRAEIAAGRRGEAGIWQRRRPASSRPSCCSA
jgi:hypothetical protein